MRTRWTCGGTRRRRGKKGREEGLSTEILAAAVAVVGNGLLGNQGDDEGDGEGGEGTDMPVDGDPAQSDDDGGGGGADEAPGDGDSDGGR